MGRVFHKISYILSLFLCLYCFALDSEFKNSLSKVEVVKSGDSSYNVNLYTQKGFSQTPRVIKKSDYNYYILLPETKNSKATASFSSSGDIKNVSTNLYQYAGADVNNGYTKINITTQKPINFNLNVKYSAPKTAVSSQTSSKQSETAQKTTTAASTASKQLTQNKNIEKKNPQVVSSSKTSQNAKIKQKIVTEKTVSQPVQKTPVQIKPQIKKQIVLNPQIKNTSKKETTNISVKTQASNQKTQVKTQVSQQKTLSQAKTTIPKKEISAPKKEISTVKKEVVVPKKEVSASKKLTEVPNIPAQKPSVQSKTQKQIIPDEKKQVLSEDIIKDSLQTTYSKGDIFVPMANNADIQDDEMFADDYGEAKVKAQENAFYALIYNLNQLKSKINPNAKDKNINFGDVFGIIVILTICGLIFKTLRKPANSVKLQKKPIAAKPKNNVKKQTNVENKSDKIAFNKGPNNKYNLKRYLPEENISKVVSKAPQSNYTTQSGHNYKLEDAKILSMQSEPVIQKEVHKEPILSDEEMSKKALENLGLNEDALELYIPSDDDIPNVEQKFVQTPDEFRKIVDDISEDKKHDASMQNEANNATQVQKPQGKKQIVKISDVMKNNVQHNVNTEFEQQNIEVVNSTVKKDLEKVLPKSPEIEAPSVSVPVKENAVKPAEEIIPGLKVLSSVEIAPERGFMCVSYENTINLIGYIFDDVYPLYNFKISKLKSYDIKFRLSQRDAKGAYFIVKVDNAKLLIKVTRLSMALEVVM